MFCPNCGKELLEDARFCVSCGREISQQEIDTLKLMKERQAVDTQAAQPKEEFFEEPAKEPVERICPYCRSKVKSTDVYCPVCKSYLDQKKGTVPVSKAPKKDNMPSLIGFILSMIAFFMPEGLIWLELVIGVASLVLGLIGLVQVNGGKGKGKGFAIAAIVFGMLALLNGFEFLSQIAPMPKGSGSVVGDMVKALFA